MNNNYKHVLFILDDSGSMSDMVTDAIGGFNQFVENQQAYAKEAAPSQSCVVHAFHAVRILPPTHSPERCQG